MTILCIVEEEWRRARGIARDVWKKIRCDSISDDVLDDIIKTFLYKSAQKISSRAGYEDEVC